MRRDSGLLGRGWTSALASEVQPGRPIDVLKASRWAGRGATLQPFSDGNLHSLHTKEMVSILSLRLRAQPYQVAKRNYLVTLSINSFSLAY